MTMLAVEGKEVKEALRTLAQFCIDQGYDRFTWALRNGPHDPDTDRTDWRIEVSAIPNRTPWAA